MDGPSLDTPKAKRLVTRPALSLALRAALLGAATGLGGCEGVLDPKGPVSASERLILFDSLAIMLVIVLPVILATIGFAWWFRSSNTRAIYLPEWEFNGTLELIVWSIPLLVIIVLGGVAWYGSHELDPFKPLQNKDKPLEVEVVALDWKWLFIYPEQNIATVNQLYLPVGRPVHFRLTSATVMNSFFIPQLGSQIYAMAGMVSQVYLQGDEPGTYRGMSAQFSGDLFPDMHFDAHVVKSADFDAWATQAKNSSQSFDTNAFVKLNRTQSIEEPASFKLADGDLFHSIIDLTTQTEPGRQSSLLCRIPKKGS